MYHYVDVGFDPEWAGWSVGTVMHMEAIRDLIECNQGVEILDFSQGSGEHKRRFGNRSRVEGDYIILQRGWKSAALGASYQGVNRISIATVALLDRLHVKAQIKRFVRRVSAS
jgi:CelD/BcsL family acetyltransferase involved in cellulose biosynthesis